jgi:hypothetical protein
MPPPKFQALKRTVVKQVSEIEPTQAEVAQDFTKYVPVSFNGAPPAPLEPVAAKPVLEARVAEVIEQEAAAAGPSIVVPEGYAPKKKGRKAKETVADGTVAAAPVALAPPAVSKLPVVKPVLGKVEDAAAAAAIQPADKELMDHFIAANIAPKDPPLISPPHFVPENRREFKYFLVQAFNQYKLPPVVEDPDPETCQKAAKLSTKELKTFQYQAFVRDYLQRASPYRGLLVFHGLGSGKTCTSIATAEALYGDGNRKIFVMTPASLSGNFRGEMSKCGHFAFHQENYWSFLPVNIKTDAAKITFLTETMGLPIDLVRKKRGAWVPDPTLPSNWHVLSPVEQQSITEQINRHISTRFNFINYNGLTEKRIREWACKTPRMFDGAVIVIDEIHNLVRTINNTGLEKYYESEPIEPEFKAKKCLTGSKYRISYLLYRMLCNAVGVKIVALSGTPIINYPQELGILANILSGDMRYGGAILSPSIKLDDAKAFFNKHPEVDLFNVVSADGAMSVKMTPVPSGYRKVIDPRTHEMRGFVRDEVAGADQEEIRRERDLAAWVGRIEMDMRTDFKSSGVMLNNVTYGANQRLPDSEDPFVEAFINKETLELKKPNDIVLISRLSGLISYYKAGKPELVARVEKDELVKVDMSDRQLEQYTIVRNVELKQEARDRKGKAQPAGAARYENAIKNQKSTFKIFSRASCNFVFPEDIPRPRPGKQEQAALDLGAAKSDGSDADIIAEGEQESVEGESPVPPAVAAEALADPYLEAIRTALVSLRGRGSHIFSAENLKNYSPKFQAIINNMETAKGPVLVYSQFKTLEGLGIFSMSLEFQKNYIKFDLQPQANGMWSLNPDMLLPENKDKKRFILYTGDEKAEKRDLLKHIFNGNWAKIPAELAAAVKELAGADNNINGKIAQAFMITQSGAEGISLENVRQVHLMEPYWNYVRLEQVKGRAIRICSHKSLPFSERTVEVFTYITKFSEDQKKARRVDETLMIKDKGLTTDESILSVSQDKKKLADSLFSAMKLGAVDCELNATENKMVSCYRFPKPSMEPLFHPKLDEDIRESAASVERL